MTTQQPPTIIAFASPKGGVGKSTSCLGIAGALASKGETVHVVDFDQTQTLWGWYSSNDSARAIQNLTVEQAPKSNIDSFVRDLYMKRRGYVLIDLAGTLTDTMLFVATLADLVIIPTKLGWADIMEANKLSEKLDKIAKQIGKPITSRLLLNEIPFALAASQVHMINQVAQLGLEIFKTYIHVRAAYAEPHVTGLPLHYDDTSRAPTQKAIAELNLLLDEVLAAATITQQKAAA